MDHNKYPEFLYRNNQLRTATIYRPDCADHARVFVQGTRSVATHVRPYVYGASRLRLRPVVPAGC